MRLYFLTAIINASAPAKIEVELSCQDIQSIEKALLKAQCDIEDVELYVIHPMHDGKKCLPEGKYNRINKIQMDGIGFSLAIFNALKQRDQQIARYDQKFTGDAQMSSDDVKRDYEEIEREIKKQPKIISSQGQVPRWVVCDENVLILTTKKALERLKNGLHALSRRDGIFLSHLLKERVKQPVAHATNESCCVVM